MSFKNDYINYLVLNWLWRKKLTILTTIPKELLVFYIIYVLFLTGKVNLNVGNSALHRCIPWLHNFWLVITLSIWLNLNIEELILSIVLQIPWFMIGRIKLHIFLLKLRWYCAIIIFWKSDYLSTISMKNQLNTNYFEKETNYNSRLFTALKMTIMPIPSVTHALIALIYCSFNFNIHH